MPFLAGTSLFRPYEYPDGRMGRKKIKQRILGAELIRENSREIEGKILEEGWGRCKGFGKVE